MSASTPAARSMGPRRPDDVDAVHPAMPRPGRWAEAEPTPSVNATAETLSAVRAELAELRARLDC